MRLLILAYGGTWEMRYQASALAASAAASGDRVDLCLFFAALDAWARDDGAGWDRLDPAPPIDPDHLASLGFPPLSAMIAGARATDALRLYACSASARILDLEPPAVQARVDLLCGWQTFSKLIAEADRVVSF